MSQEKVYNLLKNYDGFASQRELKELAKEKYPNATLYLYIGDRLKKLKKKGIIEEIHDDDKGKCWKIVSEFS